VTASIDSSEKDFIFTPKEWCYPLFIRNLKLAELLEENVKGHVLDYGCAGGKRFKQIGQYNPKNLVAFDLMIDPEAIKNARRANSILIQANGKELPFRGGSFDFILANHVIEHIDSMDDIFEEIERVLSPKGVMLLGIPTFSSLTLYFYFPISYLFYNIASLLTMKGKEGGGKIAHGKRLALVGDKNVLKVTNIFELILLKVPTLYLKSTIFSWGFTLWGALFNHKDHTQKHLIGWWKKKIIAANLVISKEIFVGMFPLFVSNFAPKSMFPLMVKCENAIGRSKLTSWVCKWSRDYFLIISKK